MYGENCLVYSNIWAVNAWNRYRAAILALQTTILQDFNQLLASTEGVDASARRVQTVLQLECDNLCACVLSILGAQTPMRQSHSLSLSFHSMTTSDCQKPLDNTSSCTVSGTYSSPCPERCRILVFFRKWIASVFLRSNTDGRESKLGGTVRMLVGGGPSAKRLRWLFASMYVLDKQSEPAADTVILAFSSKEPSLVSVYIHFRCHKISPSSLFINDLLELGGVIA